MSTGKLPTYHRGPLNFLFGGCRLGPELLNLTWNVPVGVSIKKILKNLQSYPAHFYEAV